MISFIKNMFASKKEGSNQKGVGEIQEGVIVEEQELEQIGIEGVSAERRMQSEIITSLSLHETWEEELDQEKRYTLSFLQTSLPTLLDGQVAITGFNMQITQEGLTAFGFIRNGLNRPIQFETMPLLLLGENDALVARKIFDMSEMGEIPAHSDRPWAFTFEDEAITGRDVRLDTWKLVFERTRPYVQPKLDIEAEWDALLTPEQRERLQSHLADLPPLEPGEFNISGIQVSLEEEGISVLVFLRNGTGQTLQIEQIPLMLLDASDQTVASGLFQTDKLEVKAGTAKLWRFVFPYEMLTEKEPNLTSWRLHVLQ